MKKKCRVLVDDLVVVEDVKVASNFFKRLVGLLRHKRLGSGEGLLLSKCKQIHTFGMKFNIDAVFLSKTGEILHVEDNMAPGKVSKYVKDAFWVLEIEAGKVREHNLSPMGIVRFDTVYQDACCV